MRTVLNLLALGFTVCIYWAFTQKPISESGGLLMGDPWGIVTLIDLYLGLFLFSFFIFCTSPKKTHVIFWVPALAILGNVVALLYVSFYYQDLKQLLGAKNESK